jgi:serine/threonine-protein kinase
MKPRDKNLGQDIFLEALELDESQRENYIYNACKGHSELQNYVSSLLVASQSATVFFDELAVLLCESQLIEIEDYHFRDNDFGHYKIIKVLNQGGMGTLFLGQRADGEFERQVIIKMIPVDLDQPHSKAQFAHEKEILASLLHANIVQLYDSGITSAGQSYFVMELVKGKTLIQYCNDKRLSIQKRLKLFHDLLLAVAYAHQHLVIHGDIKPSNIMVNDEGQIKLLDFGIAKLVNKQEGKAKGYSLNYLTPEHKNEQPIITTTDIHQLGQLLLELLINIAPVNIRDDGFNYTKLSVLYNNLAKTDRQKLARNTNSTVRSLKKVFNSDLQLIICTALEKTPNDRYKTIQAFADDLMRYSQGYCIHAKPQTLRDNITKYIKRNTLLTATFISMIVLSMMFLLTTIKTNKILAIERDKALSVKNLMIDIFTAANPSLSPGKELTATEVLDNGLKKVREKFKKHSDIEADLLQEIAKTYQNLGAYEIAQGILAEVYNIKGKLYPDDKLVQAKIMLLLGENCRLRSKNKQAKAWLLKSLTLFELDSDENRKFIASNKSKLGRVMVLLGDYMNAEKTLNEATDLTQSIYGKHSLHYAQALNDLNSTYFHQGRFKQVQQLLMQSKELREQLLPKTNGLILDTEYATNINNLGLAYYLQGNLVEGEKYFRLAKALRDKIFTKPHPDQAQSLTNLGLLLNDTGQAQEALGYLQKALKVREQTLSADHTLIKEAKNNLAMAYHENKKFTQAENIYQSILPEIIKQKGETHPQTLTLMTNRANTLLELKQYNLAEALFSQSLNQRLQTLAKDHIYLSYGYIGLGRAEMALGKLDLAEAHSNQGLKIRQEKLPAKHWLLGEAYYTRAMLAYLQGKADLNLTNKACDTLIQTKGKENYLSQKCLTLLTKVADS